MIGKILRHGFNSTDPTQDVAPTNRLLLAKELGDLQAAVALMTRNGDLDADEIASYAKDKLRRMTPWLHFPHAMPHGAETPADTDLCRHCGDPIRMRVSTAIHSSPYEWVHEDPDDDPAREDYGWVGCFVGDTIAEPK